MNNGLIYTIDPLTDERWERLLQKHLRSSIFHSRQWLDALRRTYNYAPVAFTSSPPNRELENAVVFSIVRSWLVAPRLVSIPFSDHVDPLVENEEELSAFLEQLRRLQVEKVWKSVELRPLYADCPSYGTNSFSDGQRYVLHRLSLEPKLGQIFSRFHRDSIQRKIRKAERERLVYEEGRTSKFLDEFYRLHVRTRRRQGLPPPPIEWFRNILDCLKEQSRIRVLSKGGAVIAAIITLQHKSTVVYKYGCSDERFHNLGGMPFLIWRTIEEAKLSGADEVDLGRSDVGAHGLIAFKGKFGATSSNLVYKIIPGSPGAAQSTANKLRLAQRIFRQLPESAFIFAGRVIYPHIG